MKTSTPQGFSQFGMLGRSLIPCISEKYSCKTCTLTNRKGQQSAAMDMDEFYLSYRESLLLVAVYCWELKQGFGQPESRNPFTLTVHSNISSFTFSARHYDFWDWMHIPLKSGLQIPNPSYWSGLLPLVSVFKNLRNSHHWDRSCHEWGPIRVTLASEKLGRGWAKSALTKTT